MSAIGLEVLGPIDSMLEFGSNKGLDYSYLKPRRYLGIDIGVNGELQWVPTELNAAVQLADVMVWEPPAGAQFDLVYCDAHQGIETPKADMFALTARQIRLAQRVSPLWIAVDDCYVEGIRDAALALLGAPTLRCEEPTQCWVWKRQ